MESQALILGEFATNGGPTNDFCGVMQVEEKCSGLDLVISCRIDSCGVIEPSMSYWTEFKPDDMNE